MSSINSKNDEVRRTRDEYQSRESENTKKQKLKSKQTTEAHHAEIESLKESHAEQVEQLKSKATDSLTRRDMEYQKEISDLRKMHADQLKRVAVESDGKTDRTESALKSELNRTKQTGERQKEILAENFQSELSRRDKAMAEYAEHSQTAMKRGIERNRENLNKAHTKEKTALISDRDERIDSAQRNYNQLRKGSTETIDNLKQSGRNQAERLSNNYEMNLRNNEKESSQRAELDREGFNQGLSENRERYRKALEKREEGLETARKDLTDTVHGRLGKKFNSLVTEVEQLKRDQIREQINGERKRDLEVKNLKGEFTNTIEDFERQRKGMVGEQNRQTHYEIKRINQRNTEAVEHSNRFFQEKIGMDGVRHQEKVATMQSNFDQKSQTQELATSSRFDKLKNFNDLEREKMQAYFDEATQTMRQNFEETLRDMRMKSTQEKNQIFQTAATQNRETEQKWQEKLNHVTSDFEKKIAVHEDKHHKELKSQATDLQRQISQNDKKSRTEQEIAVSQLSTRISQREETHKRELDDLRQKHQETLANLVKNRQS